MDTDRESLRPRPLLLPQPPSRNPSRFGGPGSPTVPQFHHPLPSPNMGRFPRPSTANSRPSTANSSRRPSPPHSASLASPLPSPAFASPHPGRFPTPPSPNIPRFPMPPVIPGAQANRRPGTPNGNPTVRYPTPPMSSGSGSQSKHTSSRRPVTPHGHATSSNPNLPRYPTPPNSAGLRPNFPNTRSATMPNMPSRPPAVLTPEQQDLTKRLQGSSIANEEDALRAEAMAKEMYTRLEDEMVMARKFRKDNAREVKKIADLMAGVKEKLANHRATWEAARVAMESVRSREREMIVLRRGLERGGEHEVKGVGEVDVQRRRGILNEHIKQVTIAKETWEAANGVKLALIEEDKGLKDLDGRRQRRFDGGIEGHDKRRYAMRSRMARASHYAIYHAQRAHNYRTEREKLIPDPNFQSCQANLEAIMQRAESYLKGPIDEDSGERFWKMHASRSWWSKIPEGPLGSPPSP